MIAVQKTPETPAKKNEVGVDWLTLTSHDAHRGGEWFDTFHSIAAHYESQGFIAEAATLLGYNGHKVGRLFVGARSDGWMCRISSQWADMYGSLFAPDAVRCTRIDLAVTHWGFQSVAGELQRTWDAVKVWKGNKGKPSSFRLWTDTTGPQGISLGSRSSERYARIYDKGKESGDDHYRGALRYELEVKGELANQATLVVYSAENRREAILDVVRDHFANRGVHCPFDGPREYVLAPARYAEAEVFVKLKWLREGVSPTVATLVERVGMQKVLEALFLKTPGYLDERAIIELIHLADLS